MKKNNEKNTEIEVVIDNLGINGEGIARWNGKAVFIKNALVGEKVKAKIIFSKPSFCVAIVIERLSCSSDRVKPKCKNYGKCGGCNIQHLSYEKQLEYKKSLVKDAIERIGGLRAQVSDTVASNKDFGYRNKMSLPVRLDKNGQVVIGLFAENSHRVVECENCLLQPTWNAKIINLFKIFLKKSGFLGYNEETKKGDVRHLVVREIEGALYISVVATKKIDLTKFGELLSVEFKRFALYLNVNRADNNVILGDEWSVIAEQNLPETVQGLFTQIHPAGFFQVNDYIREKMYERVIEEIKKTESEVIIDAYSGAGIMSAFLASHAQKAYAIEINEQAHASCKKLIKNNGITNLTAINGDVKDEIGKILEQNLLSRCAVVLDPPRAGCAKSVLDAIMQSGVQALAYVSCNPATLARDLKILSEKYSILSVTPYDMFPQTSNVETLVVMQRK